MASLPTNKLSKLMQSCTKLCALIVAGALAVGLGACTPQPKPEEVIAKQLDETVQEVNNLSNNPDALKEYSSTIDPKEFEEAGIDMDLFLKKYLTGFKARYDNIKVNGDKATADLYLTVKSTKDFSKNLSAKVNSMDIMEFVKLSKEEQKTKQSEIIYQAIDETELVETSAIVMQLDKVGNDWVPQENLDKLVQQAMMTS